jgi:hypothetical protein
MSYTWQLMVAVVIICLTTSAAYIKRKHSLLEERVNRRTVSAQKRSDERTKGNLQSLPQAQLSNSNTPALLHEKCSLPLPNYALSNDSPEHFTRLLRHNMSSFARYPQAWLLWLALPKSRHTFLRAYFEDLEFVEGDPVCGVFRVVKSKPTYIELRLEPPPRFGTVAGLLIIRLETGTTPDSGVELITETLQWTLEGTIKDLPLSKPLPKLLHEFASANLLISGAAFLESIGS